MTEDKETVMACASLMAGLIVTVYAWKNPTSPDGIVTMLSSVRDTLAEPFVGVVEAGTGSAPVADVEKPTAAQIRKSITPDALISFIDGRPYKTLKRHLTKHGLDIAGYRLRYGLPADYPSTSANYSAERSKLAKAIGLGQPGRLAA